MRGKGYTDEKKAQETLTTFLTDSYLASLHGSDAYEEMLKEFEASGSADKMNPTRIIFCLTEDEIDQSLAKIQDDTEREAMRLLVQLVTFNAEAIKEAYDNEETVLLVYPDESFINKALQAIGAERSYVLDESVDTSGHLELYALAKRSINGRTHKFTYYDHKKNIHTVRESNEADPDKTSNRTNGNVEISGDKVITYDQNGNVIDIQDVDTTPKADVTGNGWQTEEEFSIVRWRDFYEWCASLTDLAEEREAEASSIEAKAALDGEDLTKVASSQTIGEPVYIDRDYDPWDHVDGDKVRWKRKSPISFAVYACHSYREHKDYYLVQAKAGTIPQNYQDRTAVFTITDRDKFISKGKKFVPNGRKVGLNYLSGFTGAMQFECFLALDKDGISGMISGGVSYTSRETWKEKSYEIIDHAYDDNRDAETKWKLNFKGVTQGSCHELHSGWYYGINPVKGATDTTSFNAEWIWVVEKPVWSKRKEGVVFGFNYHSQDGFAFGNVGLTGGVYKYAWDTTEKWKWVDWTYREYLNMPKWPSR